MSIKERTKTVPNKDETSAGAEKVNNRLINATGIGENADPGGGGNNESKKGDKNKKTTVGTIEGKEKAKNRQESSLKGKDSDPDKSDPKSNRDIPKAKKREANNNEDNGKDKPKKKSEKSK
ncbi:MAG: hypothetical protein M3209_10175 [Acidobacteriota bacterium]|nr:hypothetical protein [Acidobacteriota bacterium]